MKEITLKVPETKLSFFMNLFKELGLEVKEEEEALFISKAHQKIVLDRIKNSKAEDLLIWDDVKDDFDGI